MKVVMAHIDSRIIYSPSSEDGRLLSAGPGFFITDFQMIEFIISKVSLKKHTWTFVDIEKDL